MEILDLIIKYSVRKDLNFWGDKMFVLYSQFGLPADITKDEILKKNNYNREETAYIVNVYLNKYTNHRILSGIKDKNLENQQSRNIKIIQDILLKGDFSI